MRDLMPKILNPGELEKLNREALTTLGTPLFFVSKDLMRPHAGDSCGCLYEAVTGLYIVYHDYGMGFLRSFLRFCNDKKLSEWREPMRFHYDGVCKDLRGLFCHGGIENGGHLYRGRRALVRYFPDQEESARLEYFEALTEPDAAAMLQQLCEDADRFLKQLRRCIHEVGQNEALCAEWKNKLIRDVLNPQGKRIDNDGNVQYFDRRILTDLEEAARSGDRKPYGGAVKNWVVKMGEAIRTDAITDTDYLRRTLYETLYQLYHPEEALREKKSLADILFDL